MKRIFVFLFAMVMVLGLTMQADAALFLRGTDTLGHQLIYDSDLNITWYDYMHWDMPWQNQVDWADALEVTLGSTIYRDWRLTITFDQNCSGYDCTNSEMGHLYYTELGNSAGGPLSTTFIDGLTGETESFLSLLTGYYIISGTEDAADPASAWGFNFLNGGQNVHLKDSYFPALAILPRDVAAVFEPSTFLLLGAGLAGVGLLRRRFKN